MNSQDSIRKAVSEHYAAAAQTPDECLCTPPNYAMDELRKYIPEEVLRISYGCGTPVGLSTLSPGEVVLDIGSGGGVDCFQALHRVGPRGRVYGLDMTDKMLEVARRNAPVVAARLGHPEVRVEFLKGVAEDIPLPDATVDHIISNCVINLSPDKARVFAQMFRVLRPGGRFTISDIAADQPVPQYLTQDPEKWGQCLSGALLTRDYLKAILRGGFAHVERVTSAPWQIIDGINFFSVTLTGFKAAGGARVRGSHLTYPGPFRRVQLWNGFHLKRGVSVPITPMVRQALQVPELAAHFLVTEGPPAPGAVKAALRRSSRGSGPCVWRGDFAILVSAFQEAEDDDGHEYHGGIPLEICSATLAYLQATPEVGRHFSVVNRHSTAAPDPAALSCCPTGSCD